MNNALDPLLRDFVEWVAREPKPYRDALEAWHTSCPGLTVWEDAFDLGYVERKTVQGNDIVVTATQAGRSFANSIRTS